MEMKLFGTGKDTKFMPTRLRECLKLCCSDCIAFDWPKDVFGPVGSCLLREILREVDRNEGK